MRRTNSSTTPSLSPGRGSPSFDRNRRISFSRASNFTTRASGAEATAVPVLPKPGSEVMTEATTQHCFKFCTQQQRVFRLSLIQAVVQFLYPCHSGANLRADGQNQRFFNRPGPCPATKPPLFVSDVVQVERHRLALAGQRPEKPALDAAEVFFAQVERVLLPLGGQGQLALGLGAVVVLLVRAKYAVPELDFLAALPAAGPKTQLPGCAQVVAAGLVSPIVGRVLPDPRRPSQPGLRR